MDDLYISGRPALDDAAGLMALYGDEAPREAAARAHASRDAGNVQRFCHWRQIERVIARLSSADVTGPIH